MVGETKHLHLPWGRMELLCSSFTPVLATIEQTAERGRRLITLGPGTKLPPFFLHFYSPPCLCFYFYFSTLVSRQRSRSVRRFKRSERRTSTSGMVASCCLHSTNLFLNALILLHFPLPFLSQRTNSNSRHGFYSLINSEY